MWSPSTKWTAKNFSGPRNSVPPWRTLLLAGLGVFSAAFGVAAETPRLLVRNAMLVTMEPDQAEPFLGWLLVGADGRIAGIGRGAPAAGVTAAQTLDAREQVVMPGFLSGHSHLASSVMRGVNAGRELDGMIDFRPTFMDGRFYEEGDVYAFTLHGSLDYLLHGITTAFNYPNRRCPPQYYHEAFLGEIASGQRFVYGYNVPDAPYEKAREEFLAFKAITDRHKDSPFFLRLGLAKNGHLGRIAGHSQFPTEVKIAKEFGLPLQVHFLESSFYQKQNRHDFRYMKDSGALEIPIMYAHFIHSDDTILAESAKAGAVAIWNPLSNGRLASGLADIPKYIKAGLTVGMGLDGQNTADLANPFENMRMGLYNIRMAYESAGVLTPLDVMRLHTLGTAKALGVADKVGSLKVGKFADFLLIDLTEPDTGPVYDFYGSLVFSCSFPNIARIYVGGDLVAEKGRLVKHDSVALGRDVRFRMERNREKTTRMLAAMAKP
ncbi:MAG TPA: amidohydrolase family protein [Opitutaceae bacterium]|nr:amidohydrolase family protein [Opitutaceae bacterium]